MFWLQQRRSHGAKCRNVVLLFLAAISCPCLVLGAATAYVSKAGKPNTALLPALQNPQIQIIALLSDYAVDDELDAYLETPLLISSRTTPSIQGTPLPHLSQRLPSWEASGQEPLLQSSQSSLLPPAFSASSSRRTSWEQTWSQTAPSMNWVEDKSTIELGLLLGAGSFARVFKAKWAGLDVAVKIIEHECDFSAAVALEAQLMMGLNHPNIVRAYHCVNKEIPKVVVDGSHGDGTGSGRRAASDALRAAGEAQDAHCRKPTTQVLEAVKQALETGSVPGASSNLHQQQTLGTAGGLGGLGSAADAQLGRLGSNWPALSVLVSEPRLPGTGPHSTDTPPTPLGFVPSFNIGSSATDPADPNMAAYGSSRHLSTLSGTFSGPRASAGGIARRVDSIEDFEEVSPPALPTSRRDLQSGSAAVPQRLDQAPEQQQQQQSVGNCSSPSSSSSVRSRWVSVGQLPVSYKMCPLPTIYSASGTETSGGTTSSSERKASAATGSEPYVSTLVSTLESTLECVAELPPVIVEATTELPASASPTVGPAATPLPPEGSLSRQGSEPKAQSGSGSGSVSGIVSGLESSRTPVWSIIPTRPEPSSLHGGCSSAAKAPEPLTVSRADEPAVSCETWIVTELCDQGTLARVAADWRPAKSDQEMLQLLALLMDVARGLKLLHAKNIVHADLNAHNILVASSPTGMYGQVAKISDLGLSRVIRQHLTHKTTKTVGSLTHQPPELLRDGHSSTAVDIYSYGILMWELYTGQAAFSGMRCGQIYHQVVVSNARPPVPPDMPDDYHLLMERCWLSVPKDRPSADMVLYCLELMIQDRQ